MVLLDQGNDMLPVYLLETTLQWW